MTEQELKTYLTNHLTIKTYTKWDHVRDCYVLITKLLFDDTVISSDVVPFA